MSQVDIRITAEPVDNHRCKFVVSQPLHAAGVRRFASADGAGVVGSGGDGFPSQADAESWVGEAWQELLADGVDAVTLLEGDRVVYGPMSLHPAE